MVQNTITFRFRYLYIFENWTVRSFGSIAWSVNQFSNVHYMHRSQRAPRELSMRKRRFVWRRPNAKSRSDETADSVYECSREWTPRASIFAGLNARDSYALGPAIAINCAASAAVLLPAVCSRGLGQNGGEKNWKSRRATRVDTNSTRRPAVCEKLVCTTSWAFLFCKQLLLRRKEWKNPRKKVQKTWIDFWGSLRCFGKKFIKIFF